MKYIIYARKSTESEERQILSIGSQISELREFAAKEKFEIVQTVREPINSSFPCKRESRKNLILAKYFFWIPAYAGMTVVFG